MRRIGARRAEVVIAYNLGQVYLRLPGIRDLDQAQRWYQHGLELHEDGDRLGRYCTTGLGSVHYERFTEARAASQPEAEQLTHLRAAADAYQQGLALTPPDAVDDLAASHNQLGLIYKNAGQLAVLAEAVGGHVPGWTGAGDGHRVRHPRT